MGYRSDGDFSLAQYFNDLDVAAPLFANNKAPNIWTGRLDTSSGHAVYRNSNKLGSNGNTQTIIFCTPEIARMHSTLFYAGKIGEIILYNNALSDAQRLQVEDYLRLKWNLAPNSPYFGPGF
jgi:hypothetical protein